jgi:hypothetical protein
MKKHRVNWAFGNPTCAAWEVETAAGLLVVRRNHALVRAGARWRQGRDFWLGGKFAGALSSRTLSLVKPICHFRTSRRPKTL